MAKRFVIFGAAADGSYYTEPMSADFAQCELSAIEFFDPSGVVSPSFGTVCFEGTAEGRVWRSLQDGTFLASESYSADRSPPFAEGLMTQARITLSGVVGASTFSATVWRK